MKLCQSLTVYKTRRCTIGTSFVGIKMKVRASAFPQIGVNGGLVKNRASKFINRTKGSARFPLLCIWINESSFLCGEIVNKTCVSDGTPNLYKFDKTCIFGNSGVKMLLCREFDLHG